MRLCPQVLLDEFGPQLSFSVYVEFDGCLEGWLWLWIVHLLWASSVVRLSSCRLHSHLCGSVEKVDDLPIRVQGLTNTSGIYLASCLSFLTF